MKTLPEKIDSKFRFVLLAANRAEQMMRGAQAKIPLAGEKHTRAAMEEIFADAVSWDYGRGQEADDLSALEDMEIPAGPPPDAGGDETVI